MLRKAWNLWKAFGELLGNILARVVLTVFYFTIFLPFGIGTAVFNDRLGIKAVPKEFWRARSSRPVTLEEARSQA